MYCETVCTYTAHTMPLYNQLAVYYYNVLVVGQWISLLLHDQLCTGAQPETVCIQPTQHTHSMHCALKICMLSVGFSLFPLWGIISGMSHQEPITSVMGSLSHLAADCMWLPSTALARQYSRSLYNSLSLKRSMIIAFEVWMLFYRF